MPDILHISDLHFGKVFEPDRGAAIQRVSEQLAPDVIVASGDFTQRARRAQYEQAREFLSTFTIPIVVTPGNHDLPVYRVMERALAPYGKYRRYISDTLDRTYRFDGLTIVSLNSTRPLLVTDGRLSRRQLDYAAREFGRAPATDRRVVVTHHHVAYPPNYKGTRVMHGAGPAVARLELLGVGLLLVGHLHCTLIGESIQLMPRLDGSGSRRAGLVVCQAGTATSSRGRGPERGQNSFNYISAGAESTVVTHYGWDGGQAAFRPLREYRFPVNPIGERTATRSEHRREG